MTLKERITAFSKLGSFLMEFNHFRMQETTTNTYKNQDFLDQLRTICQTAVHQNGWFTEENVWFSLDRWAALLTKENLQEWLHPYPMVDKTIPSDQKTVGIIMAGNIPLVGFHDFLCVLIAGHNALVKLSSNDTQLLPFFTKFLIACDPSFEQLITFNDGKFKDFDAVIATGSTNTARYFDYYFGKKPNIIRKNRHSVAILNGNETTTQLAALGEDIFRYYGLGCRSVSKIYVPKNYDFDLLFKAVFPYGNLMDSAKYANNYDYNKAVYLMSNFKLLENGFLILKEDTSNASPIASLFYETYNSEADLLHHLAKNSDTIQCIVGSVHNENFTAFGQTQYPTLTDYADGIDVIAFLLKI